MNVIHSSQGDALQLSQLTPSSQAAPAGQAAAASQAPAPKPPAEDTLTLSSAATQAQKGQAPDPSQADPTYKCPGYNR